MNRLYPPSKQADNQILYNCTIKKIKICNYTLWLELGENLQIGKSSSTKLWIGGDPLYKLEITKYWPTVLSKVFLY